MKKCFILLVVLLSVLWMPSGLAQDNDGDGWSVPLDCNDSDPTINPGVFETCGDGVDNDCNGLIDDETEFGYCCGLGTDPNYFIDSIYITESDAEVFRNVSGTAGNYGYSNFTNQELIIKESAFRLYVTTGIGRKMFYTVYIDWDRNGTFELDEVVAQSGVRVENWATDISVPVNSENDYIMRIQGNFISTSIDACAEIPRAEVEDYTLAYQKKNGFSLWPNPFSSHLTLSSDIKQEVDIYTVDGAPFYTTALLPGYPVEINTELWPCGIYIIVGAGQTEKVIRHE